MRFLDANIFLRYLTRDDEQKAEACRLLLEQLHRGDDEALTSDVVVAEVMYVLTSPRLYGWEIADAAELVRASLDLPGLRIPQKQVCIRALEILQTESSLLFEDAHSVALMEVEAIAEIVSYDRDFDRVTEVVRVEP